MPTETPHYDRRFVFKDFLSHILLFILIFSAVYLPVVLPPFQKHDDYWLQEMSAAENCRETLEYAGVVAFGRPLSAELLRCVLHPLYRHFPSVEFFTVLRLMTMLSLVLTAGLLSYWITLVCGRPKWTAVSLTTLIFVLPGFQFFIGQAVAVSNAPALFLAMLAVCVLRDWRVLAGEGLWNVRRMALSAALLAVVFFTYQTHSLWIVIPAMLVLVFAAPNDWPARRGIVFRHILVWLAALAVYTPVQKILAFRAYQYLRAENADTGANFLNFLPPLQMVKNLFKGLTHTPQYNVWFVTSGDTPAKIILLLTAAALAVFLIVSAVRAVKERDLKRRAVFALQWAALAAVLVVLTQTPQMVIYEYLQMYRVTIFYSALVFLFLFALIRYLVRLMPPEKAGKTMKVLLAAAAFFMAAMAQYVVIRDFTYICQAELDYLEAEIQPLLNGTISAVYLNPPRGSPRLPGDEHSMFTSRHDNDYGIKGMLHRIYERNGQDFSKIRVIDVEDSRAKIIVNDELLAKGMREEKIVNMDVLLKIHLLYYR